MQVTKTRACSQHFHLHDTYIQTRLGQELASKTENYLANTPNDQATIRRI